MDLRRVRAGEWVAAASGVALLVSLFLPWYGPSASAWESLAAIDVLLAFVAASGVLLAIVTAVQRVPAVPIALSALVAVDHGRDCRTAAGAPPLTAAGRGSR